MNFLKKIAILLLLNKNNFIEQYKYPYKYSNTKRDVYKRKYY